MVEVDGVPYTWDAKGNLLDDGVSTYTYDHANRLASVAQDSDTYTFAYNGLGDRLQQTVNGVPTNYTLDLAAGLTQVLADGTNTYLYGLNRIGEMGPSGWSFHLPDALGSMRQVADANATPTMAQAYEPYGNVLEVAGEARTPYGFAGEWMDRTGLVNLRARYYAPYFGAFIQPDPWAGSALTPDTLHAYLYAGANPVVYRDPSGRCYGPLQFLRHAEGVSCSNLDMANRILQSPHASLTQKAQARLYKGFFWGSHIGLAVGAVGLGAAAVPELAAVGGGEILSAAATGAKAGSMIGGGYGGLRYLLARSGTCGCEAQQWAQATNAVGFISRTALIGGVGGMVFGGIGAGPPRQPGPLPPPRPARGEGCQSGRWGC